MNEERKPSEAEIVCFEAYQVVGSLLSDLGMFNTEKAKKVLDNLGSCRRVHQDVLPWPAFDYKPQRLTMDEIVNITDELDVKSNGFVLRIARAVEDAIAARLGVTLIDSRDLQKSTHTDHPSRHWDRTCPACLDEPIQDIPTGTVYTNVDDLLVALNVPEPEWQWVPVEPTPEMLRSVDEEADDKYLARGRAVSAWKSMLAAAPKKEAA